MEQVNGRYNVGGVLLPQPFKITRIGPVGLFVKDVARSQEFYTEILGFAKTEEVAFKGRRCLFLRNGIEHHSVGLFPKELREELGLSAHTSLMTLGAEVGSYAQLRNAVMFLKERGAKFVTIPPDLYPGIDSAAHALDPDGHAIQLYYYMEHEHASAPGQEAILFSVQDRPAMEALGLYREQSYEQHDGHQPISAVFGG